MKQGTFGYTLVEVMIVLAISGVLLASAIVLFNNQPARTGFQTSMRDLDSKIQSWVTQVGSDYFPEIPADQQCKLDDENHRPYLADTEEGQGRGQGASQDCIFLGWALMTKQGSSRIEAYNVLGASTQKVGDSDSDFVNDFARANPTPIFELTEKYDIPDGAAILKKTNVNRTQGTPGSSDLAGFYTNPQGVPEGNQPVLGKTYGWVTKDIDDEMELQAGLRVCIEGYDGNGDEVPDCAVRSLETWDLCFENPAADSFAVLGIAMRPSGITTTLKFNVEAGDPLCTAGPT